MSALPHLPPHFTGEDTGAPRGQTLTQGHASGNPGTLTSHGSAPHSAVTTGAVPRGSVLRMAYTICHPGGELAGAVRKASWGR